MEHWKMFNTDRGRNEVKGEKQGRMASLKDPEIKHTNCYWNLNSLSKTVSVEIIIFDFKNNPTLYRKVKISTPEYLLREMKTYFHTVACAQMLTPSL